jgi:hypothetical protein
MLKRIKLANLRGVEQGDVAGLTRLVVLIGPNGSAKSTVLEGALIGGARYPATALGLVARRRTHTRNGARWLIRGGDPEVQPTVDVEFSNGLQISRKIHWDPELVAPELTERLEQAGAPQPYSALRVGQAGEDSAEFSITAMAADNSYEALNAGNDLDPPSMRLVEPHSTDTLHDLFSRAVQAGQRDAVIESAKVVIRDLRGLEILTEGGEPRLFLTLPSSAVPASLGGDGTQALLRMIFELAGRTAGTVLLEDAELHQHPRALSACARAIVGAARRKLQVILATHSLELVDLLLSELSDDELADDEMMSICRLQLRNGKLATTFISARDATGIPS